MDINEFIKEGTYDRAYRKCSSMVSLNPAIAYAMNVLAGLDDKDRILDPCCGSGTILIERQLLKSALCIGVDIDPRALDCAKENATEAKVDIEFKHGDIKDKKFPDNYFTKIISNLPYGIHSGSRDKNKELYRFLADHSINWLKVGGKAVFITNAKSLLKNSFAFNPNWELISEIPIHISGLDLEIFVYQKLPISILS